MYVQDFVNISWKCFFLLFYWWWK